jgi:hypothetical protein
VKALLSSALCLVFVSCNETDAEAYARLTSEVEYARLALEESRELQAESHTRIPYLEECFGPRNTVDGADTSMSFEEYYQALNDVITTDSAEVACEFNALERRGIDMDSVNEYRSALGDSLLLRERRLRIAEARLEEWLASDE